MICDKCGRKIEFPQNGKYGEFSVRVFDSTMHTDMWDGLDRVEYLYFCEDCLAKFLWENGRPPMKRCGSCRYYKEEMCFEGDMKRDPYRLPYNVCEHWVERNSE